MKFKDNEKRTVHYIAAVILTLFCIVLDQYTKHLAYARLKGQKPFVILDGIFELQYLENRGAAFGLFQNQQFFFLMSAAVISIVIVWFYIRVPMNRRFFPLRFCAVFLMAGAVGNCIDRTIRKFVVDFLYFKLIDFPIFNVADIYVTAAAFILAFLLVFYYKEDELETIYRNKKSEGGTA
ncbi:MAG: signal peptidase II [Dorea sp.]|nr:signal peptidase II [Dorea sp.]